MKVGTDGVLLGAWCDIDPRSQTLLDIGTGTGLLSLMCAQRFPDIRITAIDIEKDAAEEAKQNCQLSPFAHRIQVIHQSLADFSKLGYKFDELVCNPPFFEGSFDQASKRTLARHIKVLPPDLLLGFIKQLLKDSGRAHLIYPATLFDTIRSSVNSHQLSIARCTWVFATVEKQTPERVLLTITNNKVDIAQTDSMAIEISRHQYTPKFKELTRAFYLKG